MISKKKYYEICQYFDEILNLDKIELICCENLHVIRYHPVVINKYSLILKRKKFINIYIYFLKKIYQINLIYKLIFNLFKNNNFYLNFDDKKKNYQNIFFSHLININNYPNKFDHFFGFMPFLKENNYNLFALFNHNNHSPKKIKNYKKNIFPTLILNHNYSFFKNINLIKNLLNIDNLLLKIIKKEKNKKKIIYLNYTRALLFKYSTFRNLAFYYFIKNFFKENTIQNVLLTFEGHAWERLVINAAKINNINTIAYNQSGIFRLQHSVLRPLTQGYNPNIVMTPGVMSYNKFKYKLNNILIKNIGSNRNKDNNIISNNKHHNSKNNILVLPEGIKSEAILLINFLKKLYIENKEFIFYIRMHPEYDLNKLNKDINLKKLPSNIIFTKDNFDSVCKKCNFVLHRGSTSVLEAVSRGLIPLYLLQKNEIIFSPISEKLRKYNIIKYINTNDFKKNTDYLKKNQFDLKLIEFANKYYSKFNKNAYLECLL